MTTTETQDETLVTECPNCQQAMVQAANLYRTHMCPACGPWYHDPSLGWLFAGTTTA